MMLLLLGIAVGLIGCWLTTSVRQPAHRRASVGVLLVVYLLPALVLAITWFVARDEGRFRFALLGVGFRGPANEAFSVAVGGDRDAHGLWVSALAKAGQTPDTPRATEDAARATRLGFVRFRPPGAVDEDGAPAPQLRLEPQAAATVGLFALPSSSGGPLPSPSIELQHGDRLQWPDTTWTVDRQTGWFGPPARLVDDTGRIEALPRRHGVLPIVGTRVPIWRAFTPVSATYPLAWLRRHVDDEDGAGPPSFLFQTRHRFVGSRLWLYSADPALQVDRNGEILERSSTVTLDRSGRVHVLSPGHDGGERFRAGGVRDRRSFRLQAGRRSIAALYDTPEVYVLPWSGLEELAVRDGGNGDDRDLADSTLRVSLSMGGWQITDRSLYFRHTSRKVALEALATLSFPERLGNPGARAALTHNRARFTAATPRGTWNGRFGQALWLGGEHQALVQIDVLSPPFLLGLLALLLALAKAVAARWAGLTLAHVLIAAPVEALVTVRLLLGYRAWALPPFRQEAFELALVAWVMLPFLLIVAALRVVDLRERDTGTWRDALPAFGGWLFSLAWCYRFDPARAPEWIACHLAVLAIPAARVLGWDARIADRFDHAADRWQAHGRGLVLWASIALLPGLLRLGLLMLGFRESLPLGPRFALSLLHIPLAIVIEAAYLLWLWRQMRTAGQLRWADLLPAAFILAGTWMVPALAVSDLGLALLNMPVFLVALVVVVQAAGRGLRDDGLREGRAWRQQVPLIALALFILLAALPVGARGLLLLMPANESERNYLRLLEFAYPERLEEVARRGSEELAVMSAVMRSYTSGPFTGHGYLHAEISPHIRATALREHVPAVFVAGAWGLAGAVGVLFLTLTAVAAGTALLPGRIDEGLLNPRLGAGGVGAMLGGLGALTFAIPSLYMLLANYRLTLFTGKNMYLLGLDSTADLLESLFLVMLVAVGAAMARDDPEAPP